jgi:glycolate oxidase FAD binding subunit
MLAHIMAEPDTGMQAAPSLSSGPWQQWFDQIQDAAQRGACLRIRGGGSKDHLGDTTQGELLDARDWQGIEVYEPSELIIKARAGTPLREVEAVLAERGQCLAFEPPRYAFASTQSSEATIGGVVASGISGPARVSRGAVRDHVLGSTLLTGRGEALAFGGAVMKNVAGFDLSRLLAGSMGTLGVILDVTLKVVPQPVVAATMRFELSEAEALAQVNQWAAQPLPLDASAWWDGMLLLRLRGARAAVASAVQRVYRERKGELLAPPVADAFWQGLRDHSDEFFERARQAVMQAGKQGVTLWRISVPPTTAPLGLHGEQLSEWFGGLRWVCTPAPAAAVHDAVAKAGGHAQAFLSLNNEALVHAEAWSPVQKRLHQQVQKAFDPHGVFDTGRLWPRDAAQA